MEDKLRKYMNDIFSDIEPTEKAVELKEEILQNLIDKYHDLISEGKTPEAAYSAAITSIGDTNELFTELRAEEKNGLDDIQLIAATKKSATLVSIAVALYIMCIIPPIIFNSIFQDVLGDVLGSCLMFVMIAIATGLIIYNNMTKSITTKGVILNEARIKQSQTESNKVIRYFKSTIWSIIIVIYILLSFYTHAWHITWVIFIIGIAIQNIIKASIELRKQG
ncbi:hypothetical protein IMSAG049_00430 [Clostridiales bacterium]|nr:hypothetical protein IMSAG049_00430 [Clostridiales bacterium]